MYSIVLFCYGHLKAWLPLVSYRCQHVMCTELLEDMARKESCMSTFTLMLGKPAADISLCSFCIRKIRLVSQHALPCCLMKFCPSFYVLDQICVVSLQSWGFFFQEPWKRVWTQMQEPSGFEPTPGRNLRRGLQHCKTIAKVKTILPTDASIFIFIISRRSHEAAEEIKKQQQELQQQSWRE